ncbi:MAG: ankyrin repeat domain-containing protein [Alphaproteobacteria bacterium]|nr:ankyrin repeat domain-containing protein [Alphaproteobacteria bacterium]MBU1512889.1 ankyrin repeat domain-containing protein [Alphaproteobacteria bacterium]MBU2096670.1 ankyrin repeat domain-containing protein [Alphaproteobacteria bacterium]MBU2150553.1 ankyrin repeat domain-containing protein [Alphaproteobacteria bacterium]MBU2308051.1 ankyrin repeat domain-containing protein [Alphaproteobacteria bacterium]
MTSRTFDEIKSAYAENPDAGALDSPASRNSDGDTLLHLAALGGNEADVKDLVALGAVVNARGDFGMTALHHAAVGGHVAAAERLLALGADRSAPDDFGQTPAKVAALASHAELAALLRPSRRLHARR